MEYEQIRKIIESCHLNFLIGSGASRPFLGTLGTIEQMLTDLSEKVNSDKKTIVDASIKRHYFDVAIDGNLDIDSGTGADLESTRKNYKTFIDSLNTILNKRAGNLLSTQVNLFTTNMDLFLEYALEDSRLAFNDGFSGRLKPKFGTENFHNTIKKTSTHYEYQSEVPLFNIFKLHGSVNWKLNGNEIDYDHGLKILNEVRANKGSDSDFLELYKNIGGDWVPKTIDELLTEAGSKIDLHEKFLEAYNKLLMINPTKEKFETTTRDLTFYELLRMFSNHLEKENSVLFVFGFSFADEHIREITRRVAVSNPTLMIIVFAFDKVSRDSIQGLLGERSNIKLICDESEAINYSLEAINTHFFKKLAEELEENN